MQNFEFIFKIGEYETHTEFYVMGRIDGTWMIRQDIGKQSKTMFEGPTFQDLLEYLESSTLITWKLEPKIPVGSKELFSNLVSDIVQAIESYKDLIRLRHIHQEKMSALNETLDLL